MVKYLIIEFYFQLIALMFVLELHLNNLLNNLICGFHLNLLFLQQMYKPKQKEKSKKNKCKISRHVPTIISNKKWSTNGKTGRTKKPKSKPILLSDDESSERKQKIRNILISKGLCQIRY